MQFKQILESLSETIIIIDTLDDIQYINPSFSKLLGFEENETVGQNIIHFFLDSAIFDTCMKDFKLHGVSKDQPVFLRHKNGRTIPAVQNIEHIHNSDSTLYSLSLRDLSQFDAEHQQLSNANIEIEDKHDRLEKQILLRTKELGQTKAQLELILKTIDKTLWSIDHQDMKILYVSSSIETLFGRKEAEFYNNPNLWQELIYEEDRQRVEEFFMALQEGPAKELDFRVIRADGKTSWLKSRIAYHVQTNSFVGISHDITQEKADTEMTSFLVHHDPLTKLPNRMRLKESLELIIERSRIISTKAALLYLDIDNIKLINEDKGHDTGDSLLQAFSARVKGAITEELIRFSGDEFVILMPNIENVTYATRLASRLVDLLKEPFRVNEDDFELSCSIGISLFPEHTTNAIDLIKYADAAMYQAKKSGIKRCKTYATPKENCLSR